MERIKQALDKARLERTNEVSPPRVASVGGAQASVTAIQYSETQVQMLNPDVLREHRVICGSDDAGGLTAYKMLRTQVMQRMAAKGLNAIAITSPAPGDGKTLTAINLAINLAREVHQTVLLVDMDLRNPSIHRYFGLKVSKGIGDLLLHGAPMGEVLINPGIERLVVLPGSGPVSNSSELLSSPAVGAMVHELKARYPSRIVVFDLPPLLAGDDALAFAPYVDTFLIVLREGKTTRDEIQHSFEMLKDADILGTVLNASEDRVATYY
ncbi:MAG: CpsD/CapB family tyrosine-protein kinase [Gammaproteobacteria bacterium]|nr:CpsD/CapB family tyrosine-protein kinase [Gammaproteobacteria bacterium]